MPIPFKKDPLAFKQRQLFPTYVFDLLPQDHECFIYDALFEQLDTSSVESNYSTIGQNAYHPRLITGILIYAYRKGVFSSREIEARCHQDLAFMYISHMNCPNFRVLSDFRKDNAAFFKESFKQTVRLAKEVGMVPLDHTSTDGSKFKADTSKHKAMSYGHLKAKEEELTKEIEEIMEKAKQCDEAEDKEFGDKTGRELPEELKIKEKRLSKIKTAKEALEKREQQINPGKKIEDKKQISFTDKEARIMGKKGHFDYAYNAQISVDQKHQIIVGEHLSQNENDKKEVAPALDQIQETTGRLPEKASFDNGYNSASNLAELAARGVDAYVATGREGKEDPRAIEESEREIKKIDFTYHEEGDLFVCPAGHMLVLKRSSEDGKRIYQAAREDCDSCPLKHRCCKSEKGEPRSIHTDDKEALRQQMVEKMQGAKAKETYKERKEIVEPVFGQIKNGGFRGFHLRGFKKASGEFSLICAVHNLKKIVGAIIRAEVRLEMGKLSPMGC
jgi:transposase